MTNDLDFNILVLVVVGVLVFNFIEYIVEQIKLR